MLSYLFIIVITVLPHLKGAARPSGDTPDLSLDVEGINTTLDLAAIEALQAFIQEGVLHPDDEFFLKKSKLLKKRPLKSHQQLIATMPYLKNVNDFIRLIYCSTNLLLNDRKMREFTRDNFDTIRAGRYFLYDTPLSDEINSSERIYFPELIRLLTYNSGKQLLPLFLIPHFVNNSHTLDEHKDFFNNHITTLVALLKSFNRSFEPEKSDSINKNKNTLLIILTNNILHSICVLLEFYNELSVLSAHGYELLKNIVLFMDKAIPWVDKQFNIKISPSFKDIIYFIIKKITLHNTTINLSRKDLESLTNIISSPLLENYRLGTNSENIKHQLSWHASCGNTKIVNNLIKHHEREIKHLINADDYDLGLSHTLTALEAAFSEKPLFVGQKSLLDFPLIYNEIIMYEHVTIINIVKQVNNLVSSLITQYNNYIKFNNDPLIQRSNFNDVLTIITSIEKYYSLFNIMVSSTQKYFEEKKEHELNVLRQANYNEYLSIIKKFQDAHIDGYLIALSDYFGNPTTRLAMQESLIQKITDMITDEEQSRGEIATLEEDDYGCLIAASQENYSLAQQEARKKPMQVQRQQQQAQDDALQEHKRFLEEQRMILEEQAFIERNKLDDQENLERSTITAAQRALNKQALTLKRFTMLPETEQQERNNLEQKEFIQRSTIKRDEQRLKQLQEEMFSRNRKAIATDDDVLKQREREKQEALRNAAAAKEKETQKINETILELKQRLGSIAASAPTPLDVVTKEEIESQIAALHRKELKLQRKHLITQQKTASNSNVDTSVTQSLLQILINKNANITALLTKHPALKEMLDHNDTTQAVRYITEQRDLLCENDTLSTDDFKELDYPFAWLEAQCNHYETQQVNDEHDDAPTDNSLARQNNEEPSQKAAPTDNSLARQNEEPSQKAAPITSQTTERLEKNEQSPQTRRIRFNIPQEPKRTSLDPDKGYIPLETLMRPLEPHHLLQRTGPITYAKQVFGWQEPGKNAFLPPPPAEILAMMHMPSSAIMGTPAANPIAYDMSQPIEMCDESLGQSQEISHTEPRYKQRNTRTSARIEWEKKQATLCQGHDLQEASDTGNQPNTEHPLAQAHHETAQAAYDMSEIDTKAKPENNTIKEDIEVAAQPLPKIDTDTVFPPTYRTFIETVLPPSYRTFIETVPTYETFIEPVLPRTHNTFIVRPLRNQVAIIRTRRIK